MTPGRHVAVSALLACGAGAVWRSPEAAAAAFAGGTLLDLDHLLDWKLNRMGPFSLRRFVRVCNEFRLPRFYLVGHAAEWILPALAWVAWAGGPPWLEAAALGLASHAAMDVMGNGFHLPAFSLVWRWRHGFAPTAIVAELPPEALAVWGTTARWRASRRPPAVGRRATGRSPSSGRSGAPR